MAFKSIGSVTLRWYLDCREDVTDAAFANSIGVVAAHLSHLLKGRKRPSLDLAAAIERRVQESPTKEIPSLPVKAWSVAAPAECYRSTGSSDLRRYLEELPNDTHAAFAEAIAVSPGHLSHLLKGRKRPSLDLAARIEAHVQRTPGKCVSSIPTKSWSTPVCRCGKVVSKPGALCQECVAEYPSRRPRFE